jgi:heme/copper-type cytochrome/quinol oxidase subunit 2
MRCQLKCFVVLDVLCILASVATFLVGAVAARFRPPAEEETITVAGLLFLLSLILVFVVLPCLLMLTLGAVLAVHNREQVNERVLDI